MVHWLILKNCNSGACKLCGKTTSGGITQAKQYIARGYRNTTTCPSCLANEREEIRKLVDEGKKWSIERSKKLNWLCL